MDIEKEVPFDPGFVQHIGAIMPNIEYVYASIGRFRNFGQKKTQFKNIFPQLKGLVENYLGFYSGCILWAEVIKSEGEKPVTGNFCCGSEYNEAETLEEVNFLTAYLHQLPKDIKYYIGQNSEVDENDLKILNAYSDFLKVNKGFTAVEKTTDLVIPESIKFPKDTKEILAKIEEVIESGRLFELKPILLEQL